MPEAHPHEQRWDNGESVLADGRQVGEPVRHKSFRALSVDQTTTARTGGHGPAIIVAFAGFSP